MAQLDPSIILQARQPQIESPVNNLAKLMQVQGLQQQNQLGQMKMDEYRTAGERRNKLAALLQGQYDTPEAMEDAVLRGGYMDEAGQLRKSRMDASKAKADVGKTGAETEKIQIANQREKLGLVGQLLNGVKDQASYDQARMTAQQNGLDVSNMPPQYDPALVSQKLQQALTVDQQLAQVWKQKGYDLDVRTQAERERSNKASEATSRGQLGVAQANVGLRKQELELNRNAPKGQFIQTDQGYVLADPRTGQVQPVVGADGKPVQGKAATKNLTEGQAKANMFGSRMVESDRILGELEGKYNPMAVNAKVAAGEAPLIGGVAAWAGNKMLSDAGQMAEQAQRDFINAVLRRESGAVISEPEFKNAAKQYFPQPGDNQKVLDQKRRNRQTAINGMAVEVPGGLKSVPSLTAPGDSSAGGSNIDALLEKYK